MALISITIEESQDQIVYGFPRFVTVTTDLSSNIYYTLDGTDPTILSDLTLSKIYIPSDKLEVVLKVYATNGIDESSIIEKRYLHQNVSNIRKYQSLTNTQPSENRQLYPFGTNEYYPTTNFINIAEGNSVVSDPLVDGYSNGYDVDGYEANFTNNEYTTENYKIIYSNRNSDGSYGRQVGTLPAEVIRKLQSTVPEETEITSNMFDPRAMVIFYDASKTTDSEPPIINSQFVSLERLETGADPAKLYSTGLDSPNVNGTFIRSSYDPLTSTMTSYYYDNVANRWMIVKAPYTPAQTINNLSGYVLGNGVGGRFVYQWLPYQRRYLF